MLQSKLIVGLGSALVDILVHESDAFLDTTGAQKGGMMLVDNGVIDDLVERAATPPIIVPGGSACNTATGVARLGGDARFVGKRGDDDFGELFESDLEQNHVSPVLFRSSAPTGRVLSIITPDAQRTMLTYLGASAETRPAEMTPAVFGHAGIVHIEGYLLFNPELMMAALKAAKQAGAKISLDLASFTVVESARDLLPGIVADYVDILIANEDESRAFTGTNDEADALGILAREVDIAVLKLGPRGSLVSRDGKTVVIDPVGGKDIVDTTGAGDLWAAGFLFGLAHGLSLEKSGRLGSACGYEVCRVVGATIPPDGWARIKSHLDRD